MSMTRKDYVAFAGMLSEEIRNYPAGRSFTARVARNIANILKDDSPRFRYDTFYAACGLDEWGFPSDSNDPDDDHPPHHSEPWSREHGGSGGGE